MTTAKSAARAAARAAAAEKAAYVVTSPLLHNAATDRYEIDDEIELTEVEAESYAGAVKLKNATKKTAE